MRLTTKSEYGLICLKYLSEHSNGHPVSVTEISEHEHLPKDYVEQIFLRLRRGGIISSLKGSQGGFILAKTPSEISVKEILEALEGDIFEVFCEPRMREKIVCEHYYSACSIRPVWYRLRDLIDQFFQGITLEMLLREEPSIQQNLALLHFEPAVLNSSTPMGQGRKLENG